MQPEWQCECGEKLMSGFDCLMHAGIFHPDWKGMSDQEIRDKFVKLKVNDNEH